MIDLATRLHAIFSPISSRGVRGVKRVNPDFLGVTEALPITRQSVIGAGAITPASSGSTPITPVTPRNEQLREKQREESQQANDAPSCAQWSDSEEERAAIAEYDGGALRPWAEALARLDRTRVPPNVSHERWTQFIDDCGRFLDQGWAIHAMGLGWGPLDLFGCDRERPPAEEDHAGLLWRVEGGDLLMMSAYAAIIRTANGQEKTFHRRNNRPGELALAWEMTSGEAKP